MFDPNSMPAIPGFAGRWLLKKTPCDFAPVSIDYEDANWHLMKLREPEYVRTLEVVHAKIESASFGRRAINPETKRAESPVLSHETSAVDSSSEDEFRNTSDTDDVVIDVELLYPTIETLACYRPAHVAAASKCREHGIFLFSDGTASFARSILKSTNAIDEKLAVAMSIWFLRKHELVRAIARRRCVWSNDCNEVAFVNSQVLYSQVSTKERRDAHGASWYCLQTL
jgi:hypothetical protein